MQTFHPSKTKALSLLGNTTQGWNATAPSMQDFKCTDNENKWELEKTNLEVLRGAWM